MALGSGGVVSAARVLLRADTADLHRGLGRARADTDRTYRDISRGATATSGAIGGLAKGFLAVSGTLLGAYGFVSAVRTAFGELAAQEKVTARTNNVLETTGHIANVTAGHVAELADALLRKTGIDDEVIQSSENVILAFTNVRNAVGEGNDVFDRATKAALDVSQALGRGLTPISIALGRALQDPIKNMNALGRAGIRFTDDQKKLILSLIHI